MVYVHIWEQKYVILQYTDIQKFDKKISYAHKGCFYLIKFFMFYIVNYFYD